MWHMNWFLQIVCEQKSKTVNLKIWTLNISCLLPCKCFLFFFLAYYFTYNVKLKKKKQHSKRNNNIWHVTQCSSALKSEKELADTFRSGMRWGMVGCVLTSLAATLFNPFGICDVIMTCFAVEKCSEGRQ